MDYSLYVTWCSKCEKPGFDIFLEGKFKCNYGKITFCKITMNFIASPYPPGLIKTKTSWTICKIQACRQAFLLQNNIRNIAKNFILQMTIQAFSHDKMAT